MTNELIQIGAEYINASLAFILSFPDIATLFRRTFQFEIVA